MSDSAASFSLTETLAPWRSTLARALHRNRSRPYSRYFQLATVHPDGRPTNRTVVFRGFAPDRNALMFVTDERSHKVKDLHHHPYGEACWYFTQTREQFRLAGALTLVSQTHPNSALTQLRQKLWADLSDKARQQFYWPHPGEKRVEDWQRFEEPSPDPEVPPEVFYLGLLIPDWVDHLELRGEPQNRTQYAQVGNDQWQQVEVNP